MSIKKASLSDVKGVRRVPNRNVEDVREFIESGYEVAEVDMCGRDPRYTYTSLFAVVKRPEFAEAGVRCVKRGEHVYLVRK